MVERMYVRIECKNKEQKKYQFTDTCKTLQDATRIILTYKPRRGYKVNKVLIDKQVELV